MSEQRIFGDWGSTRLRLWRVEDGTITSSVEVPGLLAQQREPEATLLEALDRLGGSPARIVLCGMAGASGGLREVPYLPCPASPDAIGRAAVHFAVEGYEVTIVPGLTCAADLGYADVMRGEETLVVGAASLCGTEQATFILPGTHAKWVDWRGRQIVRFATAMTGEMNALLARSSLIGPQDTGTEPFDYESYLEGLLRSDSDSPLTNLLFAARAMRMTGQRTSEWARAYVSGLLVGHEVARMVRQEWIAQAPPVLVAAGDLALCYQQALIQYGTEARLLDPERCAIAGLETIDAHN